MIELKKNDEKEVMEVATLYKKLYSRLLKEGKERPGQSILFDSEFEVRQYFEIPAKTYDDEQRVLIKISFIFASLENTIREMLRREFFFNTDRDWWMNKYSRSTFYRLRKKAAKEFMRLYR